MLGACKQQAKWRTGAPSFTSPVLRGRLEGEGLSRCISQVKIMIFAFHGASLELSPSQPPP